MLVLDDTLIILIESEQALESPPQDQLSGKHGLQIFYGLRAQRSRQLQLNPRQRKDPSLAHLSGKHGLRNFYGLHARKSNGLKFGLIKSKMAKVSIHSNWIWRPRNPVTRGGLGNRVTSNESGGF